MAFGAFAALVQLVIGTILLTRNPRNERVLVFALLFMFNGLAAAATFAAAGFPEVRDHIAGNAPALATSFTRTAFFLENCTNLLILLLAFIYPRRVPWLSKAPNVVVLFAAMVGLLFLSRLVFPDVLSSGRSASTLLDAQAALLAYGIFDLAFPALMISWSLAWRADMPPERRAQFALIFAAFGVRAIHQMVFVPFIEVADVMGGRQTTDAGLLIAGAILAVVLAALLISVGLMVTARFHASKTDSSWHMFVLAFLAFGALEGAMSVFLNRGLDIGWWHALTGDFDTLVIRPVLLWFAIIRTQLLDNRLRSGQFAWSMAFILTAAAVMGGVFEAFGDRGSTAVQWTLSAIVGIAVASTTVAVWQAVLLARSEAWSRSPTPSEVYATHLEEAYRNGEPSATERARLLRLQGKLGVTHDMHRAAERRIKAALQSQ